MGRGVSHKNRLERRFVVLGYAMQQNVFITILLSPALSSTIVEERENRPACHIPSYSTLYSTENSKEPTYGKTLLDLISNTFHPNMVWHYRLRPRSDEPARFELRLVYSLRYVSCVRPMLER
jgi:hypothetical protein